MPPRIAVLIATHNRIDLTRRALSALLAQRAEALVHVYLVDDGSSDGTRQMAKDLLGDRITVIGGDGSWFWARSMSMAEAAASSAGDFDYLMWLNDDTYPEEGALQKLIDVAIAWGNQSAVVGSVADSETGVLLYGGVDVLGPGVLRQRIAPLSAVPRNVDTFHGNLVLIPKAVHDKVGAIDGEFEHAYADIDYGLRIRECGLTSVLCGGVAATGTPNDVRTENYGPSLTLVSHFRKQFSRKVLPPRSTYRLLRRHTGKAWPLYFAYIYLRTLAPPVTRR